MTSCTPHVFSPPAGAFAMDTSGSLGKGRTSAKYDGFYGSPVFGATVSSHRLTVSHGVHDKIDVLVAPALLRVHGGAPGDSSGRIYALRVGVKYAPVKYVAVIGGLGGGHSAAGGFLSPNLGFIAAFENRYVVPFLSHSLLLSAPMAPRSVRFSIADDDGDRYNGQNGLGDKDPSPTRARMTPALTYGWQSSLGARVWLSADERAKVRPSLLCAMGGTTLIDHYGFRNRDVYIGFSCAMEARF